MQNDEQRKESMENQERKVIVKHEASFSNFILSEADQRTSEFGSGQREDTENSHNT